MALIKEKIKDTKNKLAKMAIEAPLFVRANPFFGKSMDISLSLVEIIEKQQGEIEALKECAYKGISDA